jgi:hypothetical protein
VNTKLGTSFTVEVAPRPTNELGISRLIAAIGALPAIPKMCFCRGCVHFCPKSFANALMEGHTLQKRFLTAVNASQKQAKDFCHVVPNNEANYRLQEFCVVGLFRNLVKHLCKGVFFGVLPRLIFGHSGSYINSGISPLR